MDYAQKKNRITPTFYPSCISPFPCLIIERAQVGVIAYNIPVEFRFENLPILSLILYICKLVLKHKHNDLESL